MSNILVIAEHDTGTLNPSVAKTVACAASIQDAKITIAVFVNGDDSIALQAAKLNAVDNVLQINNAANEHALAAVIAPQVASIASRYSHVFGPSTTFGKDLMPRIAALLNVNQISDVMEAIDSHKFRRPIYAGNAILTVEAQPDSIVIATVRTASYQAVDSDNTAPVEVQSSDADIPSHTRFVELKAGKSDRPDLQSASKVVSGGRALASAENFDIIYSLADTMGAGVGASRAAVDAGYVPNEMQVGQTGKIIAPDLYVAIGISGAIQHLTGIKDAGTIVAINKDEEAPIFEVADIGLVGDLFKIVPELEQALK